MKKTAILFILLFIMFTLTGCPLFFGRMLTSVTQRISSGDDYYENVLVINPAGDLYVAANGTLTVNASVYTSFGYKKNSVSLTYEVSPSTLGTFSGKVFTAGAETGTGTITVKETGTNLSATATIRVYEKNDEYTDEAVVYNNNIYYGAKSGVGEVNSDVSEIEVEYPKYKTFDAYGFFRVKGRVRNSQHYDYAYIELIKDDDPNCKSQYFVRGDYDTKIWLRYGSGTYTIRVCILSKLGITLDGEGWIGSWSYYLFDTYIVNNICDEHGEYLYPSYMVQSDDEEIAMTAARLTKNKSNDNQKIRALHDYVTQRLSYDNDSLDDDRRKRQDAVYVNNRKLAVCEGYADLFAALVRCVGIKCKVVPGTGVTLTGSGGHAWNNVLLRDNWYLVDATWNDSLSSDKYYMISSLSGINNDHIVRDDTSGYVGRSPIVGSAKFSFIGQ